MPRDLLAQPSAKGRDLFAEKPGVTEDVLKSIPTGIVEGLSGLAGIPAAIGGAYNSGTDWLTTKMFGEGSDVQAAIDKGRQFSAMQNLPTSERVQQGVESVTGELYQPQTTAGEYAKTISSFVPGGGAVGGGARSFAKFALAPGLVSETAGQATEGSAAEPYARVLGAVLGGGGAATLDDALRTRGANRQIIQNAPARADLETARDAAYATSRQGGAAFDPNAVQMIPAQVRQALDNQNVVVDDVLTPAAFRAQREIDALANATGEVPLEDIIRQRRRFQSHWDAIPAPSPLAPNAGRSDRRAMSAIQREFDDWVDNTSGTAITRGSPDAVDSFREGNRLHSIIAKNDSVARAIQKGIDRAARSGSGGNANNAIRQEVGKILDRSPGLTADERALLTQAANGNMLQDVLRTVGGLSPTTGKLQALAMGTGAAVNPWLGVPAMAIGYGAKTAADRSTRNAAELAAALMRSGGQRPPVPQLDDRRALAIALGAAVAP